MVKTSACSRHSIKPINTRFGILRMSTSGWEAQCV